MTQSSENSESQSSDSQYSATFNAALQHLWGDGFLSPGGPAEVAAMLDGVDVVDRSVLDIGSGLGACAVLLTRDYGASEVVGIDVEQHLIADATDRVAAAGVGDKARFKLVEPGPIPFDDNSFDIVFTKDAIVHIPDKAAFYDEVSRVLKPGGAFVGSDWLRGGEETATERAMAWLEVVHLNFELQTMDQLRAALGNAGFADLRMNDRNEWYVGEIEHELDAVRGDRYEQLVELIGVEQAGYRLESSTRKRDAIQDGFLRPTHFFGRAAS